jgi:hypothetical protein
MESENVHAKDFNEGQILNHNLQSIHPLKTQSRPKITLSGDFCIMEENPQTSIVAFFLYVD